MSDLQLYILAGVLYAIMALVVGICTHDDNKTMPKFLDRPNPWFRGALWFPVFLVALALMMAEGLETLAGWAFKRLR